MPRKKDSPALPKPKGSSEAATIARLRRELAECQGKLSRKGKTGGKLLGDKPLTSAERSRRYREKKAADIAAQLAAARRGEG